MEVKHMHLLDFFDNSALKLEIPAYQRIYSWTPRQCFELWLDIMRASRDMRDHFSGIVIMTRESNTDIGPERLSVVDGQQRLTTTRPSQRFRRTKAVNTEYAESLWKKFEAADDKW